MEDAIASAIREHSDVLMSLPGVEGLGQALCDGEPCIRVFVTAATPQVIARIRVLLQGYTIEIEETGEFHAFNR